MSVPRPVFPGQDYLATRRCVNREFRLRPDAKVNQAFWYILGYCAQKYGVSLYAALAMSNHTHIAGRDDLGLYPDFLRDFHSLLARCINARFGDFDHFWCGAQPSMVRLGTSEDLLDKIVYTLTNPVAAGLVSRAVSWPGATALSAILDDKPIVAKRPDWFFRDEASGGNMPESVSIRFARPPGFEHLSHDKWAALLRSRIAEVERKAERERVRSGKSVVGVVRIKKQSRRATPANPDARFGLSPRVASRDKWRRVELLSQNKAFIAAHAQARANCKEGRLAIFPPGTWAMRRHHGAIVAPLVGDAPRTGPPP